MRPEIKKTAEEFQLQKDLLKIAPNGAFELATNELKDALEATRSLFAVAHNTRGMHNHARWVLGDVLTQAHNIHGDDYAQELDTFADLINWKDTHLNEVMRTSKTYWNADMRRHSYDPHTWGLVYKTEGGEHSPLEWSVYDAMSRNVGHLDERALQILSVILWQQGYTHNQAKGLVKLIAMEDPEYTEEIIKIQKMPPPEQRDHITSLKEKHKDNAVRGKYLVFTIEDDEGNRITEGVNLKVSRQVKMDDYVLENSDMAVYKTSREFYLATGMDEGNVEGEIIPTGEEFK